MADTLLRPCSIQVSAASGGSGGAKRFLEDLIGAKQQYLNEAERARESAGTSQIQPFRC